MHLCSILCLDSPIEIVPSNIHPVVKVALLSVMIRARTPKRKIRIVVRLAESADLFGEKIRTADLHVTSTARLIFNGFLYRDKG